MDVHERLKLLRKDLGFTMEKFGDQIGVKKSTVSLWESGTNKLSSQTIKFICEINWNGKYVNPNWLQYGQGDMYIEADNFSLDELLQKQQIDNLEKEILKLYFSLEPDFRRKLLQHFKNGLSNSNANIAIDSLDAQQKASEAAYIKSRSDSARNAESSVSNTTDDMDIPNTNDETKASNQ